MFGFGRAQELRKTPPSTARKRKGGTLRNAEYEAQKRAQAQAAKATPRRSRDQEAARVAQSYRERRRSSMIRMAVIIAVAVILAFAAVMLFRLARG